jgi:predicted AlkP superfamily phosphohydrolase/phosphomutase
MILIATLVALFVCIAAPQYLHAQSTRTDNADKKMIILGVDGMDPQLLRRYISEGRTPHLAALAAQGGFVPLRTSTPPQSPVAWSNFITGMDPGAHGIFDFLHLDRQSLTPYASTARVQPAARKPLELGRWRIPLGTEETQRLRDGSAFWELLEAQGVPTRLFQIPANYPPVPAGRSISGMGTPDLKGTSGTFAYFTDQPDVKATEVSGGIVRRVENRDGVIHASLEGPPNALLEGIPYSTAEFTVRVDATHPVALIELDGQRLLLNAGEWSEWTSVKFRLVANLVSVTGMVRFYLRSTAPHFALYVSPVNIDPRRPAQPIAFPAEYAIELAADVGPFYTEEMPEDTKALSAHLLEPREFLAQSALVLEERRRLLRRELEKFMEEQRRGVMFFYFSTIDQRHHMLARQADPQHPFHAADTPPDLAAALVDSYAEIDELVGSVMERMDPQTTLVVMSDHGFAPFSRQANLNTWLEQHGYLALKNPGRRALDEWLQGIDWARTRAFAIGLNSLYLNVRGREGHGIVPLSRRGALAREIAKRLSEWRDPATGAAVVTQPALREDLYHGPHLLDAPDIIVGYARGYRASWATTTGKVPAVLIEDNDEEWSGDHCIDSREVPGVLLVNRPLRQADPDLMDLTVSILNHFDVKRRPGMRGAPAF